MATRCLRMQGRSPTNPLDLPDQPACRGNLSNPISVKIKQYPEFPAGKSWLMISPTYGQKILILLLHMSVHYGTLAPPVERQYLRNRNAAVLMHGANQPFII